MPESDEIARRTMSVTVSEKAARVVLRKARHALDKRTDEV
jgi:hypothetical protein